MLNVSGRVSVLTSRSFRLFLQSYKNPSPGPAIRKPYEPPLFYTTAELRFVTKLTRPYQVRKLIARLLVVRRHFRGLNKRPLRQKQDRPSLCLFVRKNQPLNSLSELYEIW